MYSSKVKPPLRGVASNFRTLWAPALDAKISSLRELKFATPRYYFLRVITGLQLSFPQFHFISKSFILNNDSTSTPLATNVFSK